MSIRLVLRCQIAETKVGYSKKDETPYIQVGLRTLGQKHQPLLWDNISIRRQSHWRWDQLFKAAKVKVPKGPITPEDLANVILGKNVTVNFEAISFNDEPMLNVESYS